MTDVRTDHNYRKASLLKMLHYLLLSGLASNFLWVNFYNLLDIYNNTIFYDRKIYFLNLRVGFTLFFNGNFLLLELLSPKIVLNLSLDFTIMETYQSSG